MGGFLLYTQEGRINLKGLSGNYDMGADFLGSRKYLNTIDLIRKSLNHYETPQNNSKMEVPQSAIMSRHTNRSDMMASRVYRELLYRIRYIK